MGGERMEECIVDTSILFHPLVQEILEDLFSRDIPLISPRLIKIVLGEDEEIFRISRSLSEVFRLWKLEGNGNLKDYIAFLRDYEGLFRKSNDSSILVLKKMTTEQGQLRKRLYLHQEQHYNEMGAEVFADTVLLSLISRSPILCMGKSLPAIVEELKKLKAKVTVASKKHSWRKKKYLSEKGIRSVVALAMGVFLVYVLGGLPSAIATLGCGALQIFVIDP
jgi:hypothetical protein